MNSKSLYFAMLGVIALLFIGLVGGAFLINKLLVSESSQLVNDRLQVNVLSAQQTQLIKAKADIKKYQSLATIAQSVVPQDKDQAQAVREIVNLAGANGISLSSISFPASSLGIVSGGQSNAQLSQLSPVQGISGVYDMQLTVQSDVTAPISYSQFTNYLSALEHNRRTALVSSVTISPNSINRNLLSFSLILDEYIKP